MFDEEGNGDVKTQELERLMSLMGINPTKRELSQMAKDVDKDGKGTFNCDRFLGLMALYHERAKNQDAELRAAFKVFDKEAKGYIDWNTLKYVLMNAGEPLNEEEAEQMMKEADKDGDGTIDYEGATETEDSPLFLTFSAVLSYNQPWLLFFMIRMMNVMAEE
ncbi:hypothetical protein PGIGA_G00106630 [Pangasianodon gigas]|uniref:Uncharacterized protein n=1 Tax=Pangasianodon gigas TaxID=30993 RepID=A0ACC5W7Y8_PANGG|nr:hypothetical protein [Pangasianodon gigas]